MFAMEIYFRLPRMIIAAAAIIMTTIIAAERPKKSIEDTLFVGGCVGAGVAVEAAATAIDVSALEAKYAPDPLNCAIIV